MCSPSAGRSNGGGRVPQGPWAVRVGSPDSLVQTAVGLGKAHGTGETRTPTITVEVEAREETGSQRPQRSGVSQPASHRGNGGSTMSESGRKLLTVARKGGAAQTRGR